MKCARCIELEGQLEDAWECILRMDENLREISKIVRNLVPDEKLPNDPKAPSL